MIRYNVHLTEETIEVLKAISKGRDCSVAQCIREALENYCILKLKKNKSDIQEVIQELKETKYDYDDSKSFTSMLPTINSSWEPTGMHGISRGEKISEYYDNKETRDLEDIASSLNNNL